MEAPCLRVPRRLAEKARRKLAAQGLLRGDLRPAAQGDYVYLPVARPLATREAEELGGEPCTRDFEERRRRPSSIGDYLRERLGPRAPRVSSYYVVGDIAIVSLSPGVAEEPRLVAEAIASVQRNVRAVYAKTSTAGEYRVQRLIHLYGERRTHTIYRENGLSFWVDVAAMYVNPALAAEHLRVARMCREGERVLDMFAGFGGFPINIAARRRAWVVAVDINPAALDAMRRSLEMNRLVGEVDPLHADSSTLHRLLRGSFDRIIMNLPHRSTEYVGVACRLASPDSWLHVYVVAGSPGAAEEKVLAAARRAGCPQPRAAGARRVLDYAPRTYIYSVDTQLGSRATSTTWSRAPGSRSDSTSFLSR